MEDVKNVIEESKAFYREEERNLLSLLATLSRGRIRKKLVNGHHYYYLQYRHEGKVVDEYLGKEVPAGLRENLAERKRLEKELQRVRETLQYLKERPTNLVVLSHPVVTILKLFTEMGLWEAGVEIVGSWCFLLYQRFLPLERYTLRTQDLDILIPVPFEGEGLDLTTHLIALGFREHFYTDGSVYFTGSGIKVEFLASQRGRNGGETRRVEGLSVKPQFLRFMDLLLDDPVTIAITRGIQAQVPAPAAFLLHKLLIVPRRREQGKREKDLRQIVAVGKYVLTHPDEREKLQRILDHSPASWIKRMEKSLKAGLDLLPQHGPVLQALMERIIVH